MQKQKKAGRKLTFSKALGDEILTMLAEGRTLTSICKKLKISTSSVYEWVHRPNNETFGEAFWKARDFGDLINEDLAIDISDKKLICEEVTEKEESGEDGPKDSKITKRFDNVGRSKLMAETRLKVVARRKGGKSHVTLTGSDGGAIKTENKIDMSTLSTEDLLTIVGMETSTD